MQVNAQQRCDCSQNIGSCEAHVAFNRGLITLITDTKQCAAVFFYIDGYPNAALVTDGREVKKQDHPGEPVIVAGECHICEPVLVSAAAYVESSSQCAAELLMPTVATATCLDRCQSAVSGSTDQNCALSCQQHSRCLDENCVESLSRKLEACQRRCDVVMQSSMEADIDVYNQCNSQCNKIKDEISSCPTL